MGAFKTKEEYILHLLSQLKRKDDEIDRLAAKVKQYRKRIRQYSKAEQDGQLHIAPCANGTLIFIPASNLIDFDDSYQGKTFDILSDKYLNGLTEYQHGELGKGWFLARAEAEKANAVLEGMKNGK